MLWTSLQHRLLPHDTWFGVDWRSTAWLPAAVPRQGRDRSRAARHEPVTTGSIVPGPARTCAGREAQGPVEARYRSRTSTTPASTRQAAAMRTGSTGSRSSAMLNSAANSTLVSRKAATRAIGATVMAQMAIA